MRTLKELIDEARGLETDEERRKWAEDLGEEERELIVTELNRIAPIVQEYIDNMATYLVGVSRIVMDRLNDVCANWCEAIDCE